MDTLALIRNALDERMGVDPARIMPESSLRDDLGLDSLESVELLLELEHALGIELALDKVQGLATIADLLAFIERSTPQPDT